MFLEFLTSVSMSSTQGCSDGERRGEGASRVKEEMKGNKK
jgi:hypothetical protein